MSNKTMKDGERSAKQTAMRDGFEQQRKAGLNVDWFTWQIAWHDALFTQCDIAGDEAVARTVSLQSGEKGEEPFRAAVEEMVALLENGEWAEHVAESIANGDELASRLETAITELHNDIGTVREARASGPQAKLASDVQSALKACAMTYEINGFATTAAGIRALLNQAPTERMSDAARDVLTERERQMNEEGWTPEHDDEHDACEMAEAAAAYALHYSGWSEGGLPVEVWPADWSRKWWKPTTPRRDLIKAGALILAEIERIDRAGNADAQDGAQ